MSYRLIFTIFLANSLPLQASTGLELYKQTCSRCHGSQAQGTKRAPKPLVGTLSVAQLAEQIQKTMPEDDPGTLTKPEARALAEYLHENFYSTAAQERKRPPRIELARLTVPQYRHAVADIVSSFRGAGNYSWWDTKRGLKGEYFRSRNYNERQIERLDPQVKFDFGEKGPNDEKFNPHEFSARWTGSILIPETGDYTFMVRSNQAIRLFVNDDWRKPVIDATVKSGSDTEYKVTLFLLGGRVYPIQLDFSKALQGVKDKKPKPRPAFVELLWQPPHGSLEVIPARHLSPQRSPVQFVVETKFPADDRSYGWERGTTVSKAWESATTEAAFDVAQHMAEKANEFAGVKDQDNPEQRREKLKGLVRRFAERAFRQPLQPDVEKVYVARPFEVEADPELAVRRAILMILKSARFLYREIEGDSQFDVASRLSFALWNSIPDEELLKAARSGQLKTPEQVRKQAERMVSDTRSRATLRSFLHHWLRTDHGRDASKDTKKFPGFDATMIADLRTSLELSFDDVLNAGYADFRRLLLDPEIYLNGRLAKFYGYDLPPDADFRKVPFEPGQRSGVLTHPFVMSTFAYSSESSPIHRGVFLAKGILGTGLKPPQEAFSPLAADAHPNLTTRERTILQTKGVNCQTCHAIINNLGFTLENFDAVGRFRLKDNNKPVDSTGSYTTRAGEVKNFKSPRELASFLVESEDVHTAFTEQLFHHLIQQSIRAYGPKTSTELTEVFRKNGFNIRVLAVEIATQAALTSRSKPTS